MRVIWRPRQGYFMVARNKLRAYALQKNYFGFAYYGPSYRIVK